VSMLAFCVYILERNALHGLHVACGNPALLFPRSTSGLVLVLGTTAEEARASVCLWLRMRVLK
jgi:hypothetical protein